jgi:hypothetical protein
MTTSTVQPEIVRFAAGVRAALADLPAEEVDDLTEGLEADLAESLAEDLRRTLPDPVTYAAELRAAAGLPGAVSRKRGGGASLSDAWEEARTGLAAVISRNPGLEAAADFMTTLRPAWWIVRAWLATWLLAAFLGETRGFGFALPLWIPLLGALLVSVQWGRGRWQFAGLRGVTATGNVIAVLALIPVVASAQSWQESVYDDEDYAYESPGLVFNGQQLTNIFAYDAAGNPLADVQLFDQDGHPLEPFGTEAGDVPCGDGDCSTVFVPSLLATGRSVYNVFPLKAAASTWDEVQQRDVPAPGATATAPTAPLAQVPAVQVPTPQPTQPVAAPNE